MKRRSLYLILATTAALVTCEPQQSNSDIVWFPVDNEDGVFVSIYGEKRGAPRNANWRSHRRARYSGMEHPSPVPLSYDPTENRDPSFFHNINERPLISVPPVPNVLPSFQNQQFPAKWPNKWPHGQANPAENFQEILNEVFDYNKYPPVSESSGGRPGTTNQGSNWPGSTNQWDNSPESTNQWDNSPESTNQWGKSPESTNQWGNSPGTTSQWGNRPGTTKQWGNTNPSGVQRPGIVWETTSRPPIQRPNTSSQQGNSNSEWINTNRPTSQSDKLIFPDETSVSTSLTTTTTTTPSNMIPTDPPTMSPCERRCPVTPEFNPVCGTDGVTYTNHGRLKCANTCGKRVAVVTVVTCAPSDGRGKFVAIACSQLCPDVNHPVCAVDAQGLPKTFANRCFVDFAYCREGKYYVIMKEGEC